VHPHQGDHKGPHPTTAQPPPLQGLRSHLLSPTMVLVGAGTLVVALAGDLSSLLSREHVSGREGGEMAG
jgi:hypothetical protein